MIFSEMEVEYFPHLDCDVFIEKLSIFNFQFSIHHSPHFFFAPNIAASSSAWFCSRKLSSQMA